MSQKAHPERKWSTQRQRKSHNLSHLSAGGTWLEPGLVCKWGSGSAHIEMLK
ncbi:GM16281 [Drosophila sechellia]|uniref:GM16281 n=1 Tax=Drosophila sechellia TaxID=7238 RepID=B4IPW2_DROSE|nr:GM16281 [Drosophila sechellia]